MKACGTSLASIRRLRIARIFQIFYVGRFQNSDPAVLQEVKRAACSYKSPIMKTKEVAQTQKLRV